MAKKQQPEIIPPEAAGSTELALFPKLNLPSVTGITEAMNASFGTMYTRIEAGIAELPTDMTVKANREKVASYAYSISRTKTGLDAAAKDVAGDAKKIVDAVNDERSQLKTTLDKLRDKARAKLDAWEAAEEEKRNRAETEIHQLQYIAVDLNGHTAAEMSHVLENLKECEHTEAKYGDRLETVKSAHFIAVERVKEMIAVQTKAEADAAELAELRRMKAEREAAEAAQRAKEEQERAAEAETARREEERARIAQEAEEKAKRDAAEAIEREKREREAAEQRAKEAEEREARRIEDDKRREIEQEEQRKEAAARAEEQAKQREEKAKADERQRIADEEAAKLKADQERAADLAHRRKLNAEAVAGIVKACGLSEKDAQAIIIAIYKEQVPHVAINY